MYSQNTEEEFLLKHLAPLGHSGRFLDIGAYDPFELSNTRALYELGWRGVMVEPSPKHFLKLQEEYGEDSGIDLVLAAVAVEKHITTFYPAVGPVGTISGESYEKWRGAEQFGPAFRVPTVTIPELINAFGSFDFVNIDAEGVSIELFFHVPFETMQPKAVCVEHNGERLIELGRFAMEHGYQQSWISQENAIYTPMK